MTNQLSVYRLSIMLVIGSLAVGCAHSRPRPPLLLPLDIFAEDDSWSGRIAGNTLVIVGEPSILVEDAGVLVVGRSSVLLNSPADGGRYISLTVAAEDCLAGRVRYAYRVSACVAPNDDRYACQHRLVGCARSAR